MRVLYTVGANNGGCEEGVTGVIHTRKVATYTSSSIVIQLGKLVNTVYMATFGLKIKGT